MPADEAMRHADELVRSLREAGFTKIHLDCSFVCAGDPSPLTDALVATAERTTRRRWPSGAPGRTPTGSPT